MKKNSKDALDYGMEETETGNKEGFARDMFEFLQGLVINRECDDSDDVFDGEDNDFGEEDNEDDDEEREDMNVSGFDKVIGYETIKGELLQICDMIKNREVYKNLGAKLPHGLLLYGDPGLGKTLMARSFIEESGLPAYTVRRNKGNEDFIGEITETFREAAKNAPAIVFLDDMDKFANEDDDHRDAEEYVAVQAGIDEVKGSDVFVIATVNEIRKLPRSLVRTGRFDRRIGVDCPSHDDAFKIIQYYLSSKKVSENVNMDDLCRMISYSSCAELETILNEAAICAASKRKESIEMEDLVRSVLRMQYDAPDNFTKASAEDLYKTALHEAGHLVVCEAVAPGSVGLASIRSTGRDSKGGFIHLCQGLSNRRQDILVSLAGKAAVELYFSEACASGCQADIDRAAGLIRSGMEGSGTYGLGMVDVSGDFMSEVMRGHCETVVHAELERFMFKVRDILLKNREFLDRAVQALVDKETLLRSDIDGIKNEVTVMEFDI